MGAWSSVHMRGGEARVRVEGGHARWPEAIFRTILQCLPGGSAYL